MGLLDFLKRKSNNSNDRTLKTEIFPVTGTFYYNENIKKLSVRNSDWTLKADQIKTAGKDNKKIFRYTYVNKPVKLISEPENEHDKNAIMVIIAGELVGYISRDDNLHVKDILSHREIKYISAFLSGGQYKIFYENGAIYKGEENVSIKVKIAYV